MLKIYNTLTRQLEDFKPLVPNQVTFYSCGPTVYDYQHIGNLRAAVNNDIYKRVLEYNGYDVKHIINITDVGHLTSDADQGEDKMMKALKREGLDASYDSMLQLAQKYTNAFQEDLRALNVENPEKWTAATDHIQEMINLVQSLINKGYVYETSTAFYFDTSKFPDYGQIANLKEMEIEEGARIEVDSEKKNSTDFAVWIKAVGDNAHHVMTWDAPFCDVKGFPGWHIECSAMSMKYLGDTIDIHSGGVEHIGVHHPNEIAQSEAATGKKFVNYWLHNEHLRLQEGKMSKSLGNTILLSDLIKEGFNPLAFRYLILQAHYRSHMTFSKEALQDAQNGLENVYKKVRALGDEIGEVAVTYQERFLEALNDDFNTPKALAVFQEVLKDQELSNEDKKATVLDFDKVLGLGLADLKSEVEQVDIPQEIIDLAEERLEAKENKEYDLADEIRLQLSGLGWDIKDTPEGYELKKK